MINEGFLSDLLMNACLVYPGNCLELINDITGGRGYFYPTIKCLLLLPPLPLLIERGPFSPSMLSSLNPR